MAHRLAAHHRDCLCFADTRYQLALAYQEAKDYWASHPDDVENGPSEIHQQIEEMLVEEHILNPIPDHQLPEPEPIAEPLSLTAPHRRRLAAKLLPSLHIKRHTLPFGTGDASASSSSQHIWPLPLKRHTAPAAGGSGSAPALTQAASIPAVSITKLVHIVKAVTLLKRPTRSSDLQNLKVHDEACLGQPEEKSSETSTRPSEDESLAADDDASSYHSVEVFREWEFSELDEDDQSLLNALQADNDDDDERSVVSDSSLLAAESVDELAPLSTLDITTFGRTFGAVVPCCPATPLSLDSVSMPLGCCDNDTPLLYSPRHADVPLVASPGSGAYAGASCFDLSCRSPESCSCSYSCSSSETDTDLSLSISSVSTQALAFHEPAGPERKTRTRTLALRSPRRHLTTAINAGLLMWALFMNFLAFYFYSRRDRYGP